MPMPRPVESQAEPSVPALCLRGEVAGVTRSFPVERGENLIGSARRADMRLEAPSVSRRHAVVTLEASGVAVRDLGSKNGTFVNGRPIDECPLAPGDELRCGPVRMLLTPLDPGDGVLGLDLATDGEELSTASLGDQTTLPSRPGGGAPQRRHFELVDAFFEHLAAPSGTDLAGALARLAEAVGAAGAALIEWRPETLVLAAVGDVADVPDRSWLERHDRSRHTGGRRTGGRRSETLWITEGERPREAAAAGPAAWTAAVRTGEQPLGLLLKGDFPGRRSAAPLLSTLLLLLTHFHASQLAPESPAGEPSPADLDFPPGILPGSSPAMLELYRQMAPLARCDVPVLIAGETGVGKEHLSKTLHRSSPRRDGPYVAINCAAIPAALLEAELFGIGRGVATGVEPRRGKFLEATGGTLFLDEIGDMSVDLQAKLLRTLQEREIHPVGLAPVGIDVRVIAATNAGLTRRIEAGTFREDLYYRLAGFELVVPPLRHRRADLPRLIALFLRRFTAEAGRRVRGVTVKALDELTACGWPGNVRQLEHEIRRLAYLCPPGQAITSEMLSPALRDDAVDAAERLADDDLALEPRLERLERRMISAALRRTYGNQTRAARLLCVSRNGLAYRLQRLGLDAGDFEPG